MPNSLNGAIKDVIVVGFGGSGAVAALAAAEAGATVAIVDKSPRGGGNTQEAGGSLRKIADADLAVRYFEQLADGSTPADVIEAFVAGCNPAIEWLERHGLRMTEAGGPWRDWKYPLVTHDPFPRVSGNEGLGARVRVEQDVPGHGGSALWEGLRRRVLDANIDVVLESRVVDLLRERTSGRTCGVAVVSAGGTTTQLEARSGVVLACGGFSGDPGMQRAYLGMELPAFGLPGGNAGDGVRLAQAAGAELWHMNAIAAVLGYRIAGYPSAFRHHVYNESFIYVDQAAARFVNEVGLDNHAMPWAFRWMDPTLPGYPRIPGYLIFDESARRAGPIVKDALGYHRRDCKWSADNSQEIDKGWIHKGETADELAVALGISAPALARTVADYNACALAGVDDAYGRPADAMMALQPPYYGIALWPCLLNTQGGPRRNASGQVIGIDGSPIAGLFSAGELGSIWTELYPGGGNLMECIVSGIAAGRAAAGGGDRG